MWALKFSKKRRKGETGERACDLLNLLLVPPIKRLVLMTFFHLFTHTHTVIVCRLTKIQEEARNSAALCDYS